MQMASFSASISSSYDDNAYTAAPTSAAPPVLTTPSVRQLLERLNELVGDPEAETGVHDGIHDVHVVPRGGITTSAISEEAMAVAMLQFDDDDEEEMDLRPPPSPAKSISSPLFQSLSPSLRRGGGGIADSGANFIIPDDLSVSWADGKTPLKTTEAIRIVQNEGLFDDELNVSHFDIDASSLDDDNDEAEYDSENFSKSFGHATEFHAAPSSHPRPLMPEHACTPVIERGRAGRVAKAAAAAAKAASEAAARKELEDEGVLDDSMDMSTRGEDACGGCVEGDNEEDDGLGEDAPGASLISELQRLSCRELSVRMIKILNDGVLLKRIVVTGDAHGPTPFRRKVDVLLWSDSPAFDSLYCAPIVKNDASSNGSRRDSSTIATYKPFSPRAASMSNAALANTSITQVDVAIEDREILPFHQVSTVLGGEAAAMTAMNHRNATPMKKSSDSESLQLPRREDDQDEAELNPRLALMVCTDTTSLELEARKHEEQVVLAAGLNALLAEFRNYNQKRTAHLKQEQPSASLRTQCELPQEVEEAVNSALATVSPVSMAIGSSKPDNDEPPADDALTQVQEYKINETDQQWAPGGSAYLPDTSRLTAILEMENKNTVPAVDNVDRSSPRSSFESAKLRQAAARLMVLGKSLQDKGLVEEAMATYGEAADLYKMFEDDGKAWELWDGIAEASMNDNDNADGLNAVRVIPKDEMDATPEVHDNDNVKFNDGHDINEDLNTDDGEPLEVDGELAVHPISIHSSQEHQDERGHKSTMAEKGVVSMDEEANGGVEEEEEEEEETGGEVENKGGSDCDAEVEVTIREQEHTHDDQDKMNHDKNDDERNEAAKIFVVLEEASGDDDNVSLVGSQDDSKETSPSAEEQIDVHSSSDNELHSSCHATNPSEDTYVTSKRAEDSGYVHTKEREAESPTKEVQLIGDIEGAAALAEEPIKTPSPSKFRDIKSPNGTHILFDAVQWRRRHNSRYGIVRQVKERRLQRNHERKLLALAAASAAVEDAAALAESEAAEATRTSGRVTPVRTVGIEVAIEAEEKAKAEEMDAARLLHNARADREAWARKVKLADSTDGGDHGEGEVDRGVADENPHDSGDPPSIPPAHKSETVETLSGAKQQARSAPGLQAAGRSDASANTTSKSKKKAAALAAAEAIAAVEGPLGASTRPRGFRGARLLSALRVGTKIPMQHRADHQHYHAPPASSNGSLNPPQDLSQTESERRNCESAAEQGLLPTYATLGFGRGKHQFQPQHLQSELDLAEKRRRQRRMNRQRLAARAERDSAAQAEILGGRVRKGIWYSNDDGSSPKEPMISTDAVKAIILNKQLAEPPAEVAREKITGKENSGVKSAKMIKRRMSSWWAATARPTTKSSATANKAVGMRAEWEMEKRQLLRELTPREQALVSRGISDPTNFRAAVAALKRIRSGDDVRGVHM